jgi:chemotaxis protein methyltransferase CheR
VAGRLACRLRQLDLDGYGSYLKRVQADAEERQIAVDLLTTNETYFFREPKHFDFLRSHALPELKGQSTVRVWSGACSSGEEPYTIAMVLAEVLARRPWRSSPRTSPACWPRRGPGVTRWTTRRAFPGRCWRSTA